MGSRWRELDAHGRVAADVVVAETERYDVSNCDELTMRRVRGRAGAGVYVSADAPYAPPAIDPWQPPVSVRIALEKFSAAWQAQTGLLDPDNRVAFQRRVLFFSQRTGRELQRFAVVGGRTALVARWDGGQWVEEFHDEPTGGKALERAFKPLAVTDMDRDGQPEVVLHLLDGWGEAYGDLTISRARDGKWKKIMPGIYGSTA